MESLVSATAVTRLKNGKLLLATTNEGLFMKEKGEWYLKLPPLKRKIRDLINIGSFVYGVGDNGVFIKSSNEGIDWSIKQFPTKATIWNVCGNGQGLVVTHGEKVIYVSTNFGEKWSIIEPFSFCSDRRKPSIRSLCLHNNHLYIGTKVHSHYGGVWRYSFNDGQLIPIKFEVNRMIASMMTAQDCLLLATGSSRHRSGSIEFCPLEKLQQENDDSASWNICESDTEEGSYLDISENKGILYATTNQRESGYSTVFSICLTTLRLQICSYIKGHGWRICNNEHDFVVAGLYESMSYSHSDSKKPLFH